MLRITILYHFLLGLTALYLIRRCQGRFFYLKFILGAAVGLFFAAVYALVIGDLTGLEIEAPVRSDDTYERIRMFSSMRLFSQGVFIEGTLFILAGALSILFGRNSVDPLGVKTAGKNRIGNDPVSLCSDRECSDLNGNDSNSLKGTDLPDRSRRLKTRFLKSSFLLILFVVMTAVGIDAFLIEPHLLQIRTLKIESDRVSKPVRIVFMSDIETDRPNSYVRRVFETMKEQKPDLFLFGGDYIQYSRSSVIKEGALFAAYRPKLPRSRTRDLRKEFNAILKEMNFQAPLGCYAVSGSPRDLRFDSVLFKETQIQLKEKTETIPIGDEIFLTCLNPTDSQYTKQIRYLNEAQKKENRFHILLGHIPDFVMNYPESDLVLCGHTHGGQICLPFIGALVTETNRLPKSWASGHRKVVSPDGKKHFDLIVSAGANLEAGGSPRMRFCCPPDFWIIEITPPK